MPRIQKSIEIDVSADRLWQEAVDEFDQVAVWASVLDTSRANTEVPIPPGATVGGRVCDVPGFGQVRETFLDVDREARTLLYEAEGLPTFVKKVINTWTVTPLGPERSRITMDINMETGGAGRILTPMLGFQLRRQVDTTLDDLKVWLETGRVSPAKQKANAKLARKGKPVQLPGAA
ncbi:MAG: SRPBCC family protein [Actinomycetota bacterium]